MMAQFVSLLVTEVRISRIAPVDGLFAIARVVLNDALVLDGIGVHHKLNGGFRLTYPTRRLPNGESKTLFHPIKKSLSIAIEEAVFSEISMTLKDVGPNDRHNPPDIR